MKAESANLQRILYSPSRYIIPVFQRYYTWGASEWGTLWSDIIELYEPGQEKSNHFMGSLVFVPEHPMVGQMPSFQVVDGQQRLTTLSLLLCALRDFCANCGLNKLADELTENYIIHRFEQGEKRLRISPRQRDRREYHFVVLANDHKMPIEEISNAGKAYYYFLKQIQFLLKNKTEQEARAFFELVRSRLDFVSVTLDAENPYQIFKSLNSTGVDLSESDLIRNFVFMHVKASEQDDFDDKLWRPLEKHFEHTEGKQIGQLDGKAFSGFFRDFLMRDGTYVGPDATFESFEKRYETEDFSPHALAQELKDNIDFYDIIRGYKKHASAGVTDALDQLRAQNVATTRPLLLNMMHLAATGAMSDPNLEKAIRLLCGFVFRRLICGEQSRAYGKLFVVACKELKNNPLEDLRQFLRGRVFPDDTRFKKDFVRFSLYRSTDAKSVLSELERRHQNHIAKEAADLSKVQIEHVMPQKLSTEWKTTLGADAILIQEEWLHTPGNLTLTGYNQSFGNKPFFEKCNGWLDVAANKKVPGYKDSNIAITKEIALQSTWTGTEIERRGQALAELAVAAYVDSDF